MKFGFFQLGIFIAIVVMVIIQGCLVLSSNNMSNDACQNAFEEYKKSVQEYIEYKNYLQSFQNNPNLHQNDQFPNQLDVKSSNIFRNESILMNCLQKKAIDYSMQYKDLPIGSQDEALIDNAIDSCKMMNQVAENSIDTFIKSNRKQVVMECFRMIAKNTGSKKPCREGGIVFENLIHNYVIEKFNNAITVAGKYANFFTFLGKIEPIITQSEIEQCYREADLAKATMQDHPFQCYSGYIMIVIAGLSGFCGFAIRRKKFSKFSLQ